MTRRSGVTMVECLVVVVVVIIFLILIIPAILGGFPLTHHVYKLDRWQYTVYEIDTCEYISYASGLSHKGNCKFCEDRKNRRMLSEKP